MIRVAPVQRCMQSKLILDMQKSFEMVAKEIDENLSETGTRIKENISELRGM